MNKIYIGLSVLCLTVFLQGCAANFADSDYFAEIPSEYLVNEKGQYVNKKGEVVSEEHRVRNKYYDDYVKKWGKDVSKNASLPVLVPANNTKEEIKYEQNPY